MKFIRKASILLMVLLLSIAMSGTIWADSDVSGVPASARLVELDFGNGQIIGFMVLGKDSEAEDETETEPVLPDAPDETGMEMSVPSGPLISFVDPYGSLLCQEYQAVPLDQVLDFSISDTIDLTDPQLGSITLADPKTEIRYKYVYKYAKAGDETILAFKRSRMKDSWSFSYTTDWETWRIPGTESLRFVFSKVKSYETMLTKSLKEELYVRLDCAEGVLPLGTRLLVTSLGESSAEDTDRQILQLLED